MDTWDDKSTGEKRSKIRVTAERVQFLDRRGDPQGEGGSGDDYGSSAEPRGGAKRGQCTGPRTKWYGRVGGASEPSAPSSSSSAAANVSVGALTTKLKIFRSDARSGRDGELRRSNGDGSPRGSRCRS